MMTDKEIKRSQELFGKTEELEAEIKRLQELADYRLKLLTKMPSQWQGLTDEDRKDFYQGKYVISDDDLMDAVEAKLKEKNT
jgi:hypothetical protein